RQLLGFGKVLTRRSVGLPNSSHLDTDRGGE
ncbi:MAG: hypothetical protein ACJAUC_004553, partial [Planctomycetota bacterium]